MSGDRSLAEGLVFGLAHPPPFGIIHFAKPSIGNVETRGVSMLYVRMQQTEPIPKFNFQFATDSFD